MEHPLPIQIIDLAIAGASQRIGVLQNEIQLLERFGNKAMIRHEFYHPENLKRNEQLYSIKENEKRIEELIQIAAKLKNAREAYFDKKFDEAIKDLFKK